MLADFLKERFILGLARNSIETCSDWAVQYRVMGKPFPGPYTFKWHPWLKPMHDADSPMIVGQKSAQAGYTEWALNMAFYNIDIKNNSVLYLLPSQKPDAYDFSSARFDVALELSEHISKMFSSVKNIGHKRAGSTNLYLRGAKSRSQLKSIPAGLIIFDEVDEMDGENITLAMARSDGQKEEDQQNILLSTPSIEDVGINYYYKQTTQEHYFFKCPSCSRSIELTFPECLVITAEHADDVRIAESHVICGKCKNIIDHKAKHLYLAQGESVASRPGMTNRGFHINQLYSSTQTPAKLAAIYLRASLSDIDMQEFYNSKLGLTRTPEGGALLEDDFKKCRGDHENGRMPQSSLVTMGVDVGTQLHVTIDEWKLPPTFYGGDVSAAALGRTIYIGTATEFSQLDELMDQYKITMCVIDAQPERRAARDFAERNFGRAKYCFYVEGISSKELHTPKDHFDHGINVDRTSWIDAAFSRIRNNRLKLPRNLPFDYQQQLMHLVKTYKKDRSGNPVARYVHKENRADHYAHSRTYSEIALNIAYKIGEHRTITA